MRDKIKAELDRLETEYVAAVQRAENLRARADRMLAEAKAARDAAQAPLMRLLGDGSRAESHSVVHTAESSDTPDLKAKILVVLPRMTGTFSLTDIKDRVLEKYPGLVVHKSSWPRAAREIVDSGRLVMVQRGRGVRPSLFCHPDSPTRDMLNESAT